MDRHTSNKGFTLAEMCIVLFGIGILGTLFVPAHFPEPDPYLYFPDMYLLGQSDALASADSCELYEIGDGIPVIHFNSKGNVNKAMTLTLGNKGREIVIELGGGRLVFR